LLFSGPEFGLKTWDLRAAAREGKTQIERVCGISSGPGCSTLLLYCPKYGLVISNYASDLWN
jgi:hypothetical protein